MGALKDELNELLNSNRIMPEDIIAGLNKIDRTIINDAMRDRAKHGLDHINITIDKNSIYTESIYKNFKICFEDLVENKSINNDDEYVNIITDTIVEWLRTKYQVEEGMAVSKDYINKITISWRA